MTHQLHHAMTGAIRLTYDSKETAVQAYQSYVEQGYSVEYDTTVDVIEDECEKKPKR